MYRCVLHSICCSSPTPIPTTAACQSPIPDCEQLPGGVDQGFRMPLDASNEMAHRMYHPFDYTVVSPGLHCQIRCHLADSLMVKAVDIQPFRVDPQRLLKQAARGNHYLVREARKPIIGGRIVSQRSGAFLTDILDQGAAQGNI